MGLGLSPENEQKLLELVRSGRIPHTVIIEGADAQERENAAMLLSAGAVCTGADRPCMSCQACRKLLSGAHPDFFAPQPSKDSKLGILKLKDLRDDYLTKMSIKPNEAELKIFLFREADKLLREDSQNSLLKTIEEPPQRLLFIFTAESAKSMLLTVRSRARIITLSHTAVSDEEGERAASGLIAGLVSNYEYDQLLALFALNDKEKLISALGAVTEKLRAALSAYSGIPSDDEDVKRLTRRLDRVRVIALLDITGEAVKRLGTNVNLQLLTTWLSSQYRRITWQK